MSVSFVM